MTEEGKNPTITAEDLPIVFQVKYLGKTLRGYQGSLSMFYQVKYRMILIALSVIVLLKDANYMITI